MNALRPPGQTLSSRYVKLNVQLLVNTSSYHIWQQLVAFRHVRQGEGEVQHQHQNGEERINVTLRVLNQTGWSEYLLYLLGFSQYHNRVSFGLFYYVTKERTTQIAFFFISKWKGADRRITVYTNIIHNIIIIFSVINMTLF